MAPWSGRVVVRSLTGQELDFSNETHCTVAGLKRKVFRDWRVDPACQNLVLGARVLHDDFRLAGLVGPSGAGGDQSPCSAATIAATAEPSPPLALTLIVSTESIHARLTHEDVCERWAALEDLLRVAPKGEERAVSALSDCLRDRESVVRLGAVRALAKVAIEGDALVVGSLSGLASDPVPDVRQAVAEALAKLATPYDAQVVSVMRTLALDRYKGVACASVAALARVSGPVGDQVVISDLVDRLADSCPSVREAAAKALAQTQPSGCGPLGVIEALVASAADAQKPVRKAVVQTLAEVAPSGDALAIATIIGRVEDWDGEVRIAAVEALGRLARGGEHQDALSAVLLRLEDWHPGVRLASVEALVKVAPDADRRTTDALCSCLAEDFEDVRAAAVKALALKAPHGDRHACSALIALLEDHDDAVEEAAVDTLASLLASPEAALVALASLKGHADGWVRQAAARVQAACEERAASEATGFVDEAA